MVYSRKRAEDRGRAKPYAYPAITLTGLWLYEAGFQDGDALEVRPHKRGLLILNKEWENN